MHTCSAEREQIQQSSSKRARKEATGQNAEAAGSEAIDSKAEGERRKLWRKPRPNAFA